MAKKDKDKDPTPNPASIQNKDIIQRLNFLYQASLYLTNLSQDVPSSTASDGLSTPTTAATSALLEPASTNTPRRTRSGDKETDKDKKRTYRRRIRTTDDLARAYVDTMTNVGKKTTVKMDPSVKRTLCKACYRILIPGVSVSVSVKRSTSHKHALELTCVRCGYTRSVPAPERKGWWGGRTRWDADKVDDTDTKGEGKGKGEENGTTDDIVALNEKEPDAKKNGKKRRIHPPLPLSARRDAGHAVFRGSERVDVGMDEMREVGDGVFAV